MSGSHSRTPVFVLEGGAGLSLCTSSTERLRMRSVLLGQRLCCWRFVRTQALWMSGLAVSPKQNARQKNRATKDSRKSNPCQRDLSKVVSKESRVDVWVFGLPIVRALPSGTHTAFQSMATSRERKSHSPPQGLKLKAVDLSPGNSGVCTVLEAVSGTTTLAPWA